MRCANWGLKNCFSISHQLDPRTRELVVSHPCPGASLPFALGW